MISGWLFVDKPIGVTSFEVVKQIRKILKIKKVGHAGTLDPLASGLLAIAFNDATKTIEYIMNSTKVYTFTIQFGEKTTTYDKEGEVIEQNNFFPNYSDFTKIIPKFTGNIEQTPPIYSAIKINGERAYKLAREGKTVTIPKRKVNIYSLKLLSYNSQDKQIEMQACVSKGTYIRSLGVDMAECLGGRAYVNNIRRTQIGKFNLDNLNNNKKILIYKNILYNIQDIQCILEKYIFSIEDLLNDILVYPIDILQAEAIWHGKNNILQDSPLFENQLIKVECNLK